MTSSTRLLILVSLILPSAAAAQATKPDPWAGLLRPTTHKPTPTTAAITVADLRTRLFIFADDSMAGRSAGTEGNYKGVEYIASEARRFGLQPAGQDATFFQTVHVATDVRTFSDASSITAGQTTLAPWKDFLPRYPFQAANIGVIDGVQVIFGGNWADSTTVISNAAAAGKFVVITSTATVIGNPPGIPSRQEVVPHFSQAAGIAVVGMEAFPDSQIRQYRAPLSFRAVTGPIPSAAPYIYVTRSAAAALLGTALENARAGTLGVTLHGSIRLDSKPGELTFDRPLRNVVALLPGSDPVLRNQFVVIGAHNDHIGTQSSPQAHDSVYVVNHLFRHGGADDAPPQLDAAQQTQVNGILAGVRRRSGGKSARPDSIYNGADDDGSGSVSLLEIAEQFAAQKIKPKRSVLFVWHVAEEHGLWGSEYFTDHPTVPRDSIVAELNMDMVGRGAATDETGNSLDGKKLHGGPGYLQAVGSRRLSTELGDLAESINKSGKHGITFDYAMDANGHPQNIYCRSDHAEYARYGIPIAFFTTGGHADYHQLTDEPQYIDYNKMMQVDKFVADLAKHVANLDHRVNVDKPKPDPKADCQQ